MSYGSLGKNATTALSEGMAKKGTWVNTGEGGLSPYHLAGGVDFLLPSERDCFGFQLPLFWIHQSFFALSKLATRTIKGLSHHLKTS
ncbi:hypothetical protein GW626_10790 [Peribacillus muralis]